jgi:hypothetical protein
LSEHKLIHQNKQRIYDRLQCLLMKLVKQCSPDDRTLLMLKSKETNILIMIYAENSLYLLIFVFRNDCYSFAYNRIKRLITIKT